MNPILQKVRRLFVSEEEPTDVEDALATRPQASASATKSQQGIPPTGEDDTSEESFSPLTDLANDVITCSKLRWQPSREERKSDRCPVPQSRQSCEVKVGASVLSASLVNESQSGFGVLIDRLEGIKAGKKVELHTKTGWVTVRVVYVKKVAAPRNTTSKSDAWFWLGMKKA
jgi:hypothetical protein